MVEPSYIYRARENQQIDAIRETLAHGDGGGTLGGMSDDWKASVDRQLEQLHGDVRKLLYAMVGGAIILAGAGWVAYDKLNDQMTGVRAELSTVQVGLQRVDGKIDTVEARLGGKLDVLLERKDQASKK